MLLALLGTASLRLNSAESPAKKTETNQTAEQDRSRHWAWRAVQSPPIPSRDSIGDDPGDHLSDHPIDRFIQAKLAAHQLDLSPAADRRTLIRRLYFDLLGLPPEPAEVQAFELDPDPLAYERLVDRLLASPRYGERWARHWLDIAHYADTHGFERDQRRDHAWRYRDWVVQAFNNDLPYDQFLRDQIAGDVLRPDDPQAVIAAAFLAAGPWDFVGQAETPSPVLKRLARADDLDDIVTQVITATCGVTIQCARCHDHKLDPISQREYYGLWAVFAGVKRGDRIVSATEERRLQAQRTELEATRRDLRRQLALLRGTPWQLADIVGGGDGLGTGTKDSGIDPASGKAQTAKRAFLEGAAVNQYQRSSVRFIDGVVIPSGGDSGEVPISSTGLVARGIPRTSGRAWDALRNGPVHSQFSTKLGDIDYAAAKYSLLALHANAGVTFDLQQLRAAGLPSGKLMLRGSSGYFGEIKQRGASIFILVDGERVVERLDFGRDDGLAEFSVAITEKARFLTLLATDSNQDISHDQVCFVDLRLETSNRPPQTPATPADAARVEQAAADLAMKLQQIERQLTELPPPAKVYGVIAEKPPVIHDLMRGNPEEPGEVVNPGLLDCLQQADLPTMPAQLESDAERRVALVNWLTHPAHPLTRRVLVNRLWHHHFGCGLVDTPSDFGLAGGTPSHPELLDWLATEFLRRHWSIKSLQRTICLSATYRQQSAIVAQEPTTAAANKKASRTAAVHQAAQAIDASNRLLWRQNPRRLDAESLRDAVLAVSGNLNQQMFGPGYRDFHYQEEYAPVYTYLTPDRPELWRRTIYRFIVRTTPHAFLTRLDCPDPANLTPVRTATTTALQSLALLNNDFMLKQADHFARRVTAESSQTIGKRPVVLAFELAFGRSPTADELQLAERLAERHGLAAVCRFLLNTNEFVHID
jgi:hypothetical protein